MHSEIDWRVGLTETQIVTAIFFFQQTTGQQFSQTYGAT